MPEKSEEVVRRIFENPRDVQGAVDAFAEDVTLELHAPGSITGAAGGVTGKEAVIRWFADWFRQFDPDYRFEIHEIRDAGGGRVFVDATHHGRGRASGAPVAQRMAYVYTVRDGKVACVDVWLDTEREAALAAARLSQ